MGKHAREGRRFSLYISEVGARAAASPGYRIASTFAVAVVRARGRARSLQSIPTGKSSSRAKVYVYARIAKRCERGACERIHIAAEGSGSERASAALAYEIRQRARAPLRRKVKAPVKDMRRNVRSICRNARVPR